MPEGPEVRREADQLHRALAGRVAHHCAFAFSHLEGFGRELTGRRPNLLRLFLDHPDLRTTIIDWDDEVRRLVRQFRAHTTAFPSEALSDLVDELQAEHPAFAAAWDRQDVEPLAPHGRMIRHGSGVRTYDQHRLPLPDRPGWLIVLFIPVGDPPATG